MDISAFFQQSEGKWFSQRTSHRLGDKPSQNGRSDVQVELLPTDHAEVTRLCEQAGVTPTSALFGVRITWSGIVDGMVDKQQGSTLLVPLASDSPSSGEFVRSPASPKQGAIAGRYSIGSDDVLTLTAEYERMYSEERLWFAGPNFRLRTNVVKQPDGSSITTFFSEIRMGGLK